jgi:hypothetical protein
MFYPRADGAKRRARVLIPPPAIYTRENESISVGDNGVGVLGG